MEGVGMEDLSGLQFGDYQILYPLGMGGMAVVYRALWLSQQQDVALKILPQELAATNERVARFTREAEILARLKHPNIVPLLDSGNVEGHAYMALQLVEGGTLALRMKTHGVLPLPEIKKIIAQVGGALAYAHRQNLVHRDVKPSNVLLDGQGRFLLSDFGITKLYESTGQLTKTGHALGTPAYMSPEQVSGQTLDQRSDIYALGIMLYEMATGQVPYEGDTPFVIAIKHVNAPLPPPQSLNPAIPMSLVAVIEQALAKRPQDRFQTVGALIMAMQAVEEAYLTPPKSASAGAFLPTLLPDFPATPTPSSDVLTRLLDEEAEIAVGAEPLLTPESPNSIEELVASQSLVFLPKKNAATPALLPPPTVPVVKVPANGDDPSLSTASVMAFVDPSLAPNDIDKPVAAFAAVPPMPVKTHRWLGWGAMAISGLCLVVGLFMFGPMAFSAYTFPFTPTPSASSTLTPAPSFTPTRPTATRRPPTATSVPTQPPLIWQIINNQPAYPVATQGLVSTTAGLPLLFTVANMPANAQAHVHLLNGLTAMEVLSDHVALTLWAGSEVFANSGPYVEGVWLKPQVAGYPNLLLTGVGCLAMTYDTARAQLTFTCYAGACAYQLDTTTAAQGTVAAGQQVTLALANMQPKVGKLSEKDRARYGAVFSQSLIGQQDIATCLQAKPWVLPTAPSNVNNTATPLTHVTTPIASPTRQLNAPTPTPGIIFVSTATPPPTPVPAITPPTIAPTDVPPSPVPTNAQLPTATSIGGRP